MEASEYQPFPPEIHEFVDGRMDAETERAFRRRMEGNAALAAQVEQLQGALKLLRELPVKAPPPDFDKRVIGRIREEELAERARGRILRAHTPLWQHAVQVGAGAVAAALVLAVVGVPGLWQREPDVTGTGGALIGAEFTPTEEDLLPALGDHLERTERLRRNVNAAGSQEPAVMRQLLRIELESSDLARRNQWLEGEVMRLPAARRMDYMAFLGSLGAAIETLDTEIIESNRAGRPVDAGRIRAALDKVAAPDVLSGGYSISSRGTLPDSRGLVAAVESETKEMRLFARVRRAEYRHDPQGVLQAADEFLAEVNQYGLSDHVRAARVRALLDLDRDPEAARYFNEAFAEEDYDIPQATQAMLRAYFKDSEKLRLQSAREALK